MIKSISKRYSSYIYSLEIKYSIGYPSEHRICKMKVLVEKILETFKMFSRCCNIYTYKFKWPLIVKTIMK